MQTKKITYDEVIQQITEIYETLDGDELAEEHNRLLPGQPIGYDGEGNFSRSIEGVRNEN